MADEQRKKAFADMTAAMLRESEKYHDQKQQLIQIVLEKTDSKSRLRTLKQTLLQFQLKGINEQSSCQHDVPSASNIIPKLFTDIPVDHDAIITDILKTALEPSHIHHALLKKIGEVIRSDSSDDDKIDKISDLLL